MSSQKKKQQCSKFEPQTWRKSLCKNCFKTKNEHPEDAIEEPQTPDYASDGACSPDVFMGDKIIVRRSFSTPPRDCQHTDPPPALAKKGPDIGRRTPTPKEEPGKEAFGAKQEGGKADGDAAGFRKDGKADDAKIISLSTKGTPPVTLPLTDQTGKQGKNTFRLSEQVTPVSEPETSPVIEAAVKSGTEPGKSSTRALRSSSSSPSPLSEGVKKPNGDVAPLGEKTRAGSMENGGSVAEISKELKTDTGKKVDEKVKGEDGVLVSNQNQLIGKMSSEASSSINNHDKRSVLGSDQPTCAAPISVERDAGKERDDGKEKSVHKCTPGLERTTERGLKDKVDGGDENNCSSKCSQTDARTEIAEAVGGVVDPIAAAAASSYVQSLQISLTSPVNTEALAPTASAAATPTTAASPVLDSRNSYGIRHGSSSTDAASAADAVVVAAAGDRQQEPGSGADEKASRSSSSTATVTQFQLANGKSGNNDTFCKEGLTTNDDQRTGLNLSQQTIASNSRSSSSSQSSTSQPANKSVGPAPAVAAPVSSADYVNNTEPPRAKPSTSAYQYIDANDSRLSYSAIDGDAGSGESGENLYYLTSKPDDNRGSNNYSAQIQTQPDTKPWPEITTTTDQQQQSKRKVTSLFHHVPGDDENGYADDPQFPGQRWTTNDLQYRNEEDFAAGNYNNQGAQQPPGFGRRRRRSRVLSLDDTNDARMMSGFDYGRSDAMMEGTRMVMESLREKVVVLQESLDRQEREKCALGDLLAAKKSDYEMMKDHFNGTVGNLETEVLRLKSEKSRLLDKLQLPESERASLAAEENEIAELKKKLEEFDNRYAEVVGDNEELKQEVRDLQLEMEEMHDQFREEEAIEFRELQKELENTAKNCRILQFKLRKSERRNEQLEGDKLQYDEKLRHYESCFQSSDDKRRIRVLEDDLRITKESVVRLHADLERAEERRIKHQEEVDRAKNSVNEADNKRLCLQNEIDSMKHEMTKLKDQLRFDGRQDFIKGGLFKTSSIDNDTTIAQLTKDLKDSVERENDLKEQLKFSEEENATMREKLLEMEEETESMSLQLRKLSTAKSGKYTKGKAGDADSEAMTERESELKLQMELAEQEVKVLKRKMDDLQQDNDNLLCAIKYLRSKLEQRDGLRSSTPIGEPKSTKELLTRLGATLAEDGNSFQGDLLNIEVESHQKEVQRLKKRIEELEKENARVLEDCKKNHSVKGVNIGKTDLVKTGATEKEKNLMKTIEELEQLLMQEKENVQQKQTLESSWNQEKTTITQELSQSKEELKKVTEELEMLRKQLSPTKDKIPEINANTSETEIKKLYSDTTKELEECRNKLKKNEESIKKMQTDFEKETSKLKKELLVANDEKTKAKEELKSSGDYKQKLDALQAEHDKLLKEDKSKTTSSSAGGTKDREPASWRWEKQDLEKQVKEFKKKFEDLQAEMKKSPAKGVKETVGSKVKDDSKDECEQHRKQLEEMKKKLTDAEENLKKKEKEKEKVEKELKEAAKEKTDAAKTKDLLTKQKDDLTTEKKKLTKDLETEKKKSDELLKDKEKLAKEKEEWTSEKKLVQERDAALKEEKAGKESDDSARRSSSFGLRSKVGIGAKSPEVSDSAKVKELMDTLEKKEAEIKALKAKGSNEKLGFQAKEVSDLKKEKEKLEQDLEKTRAEKKSLKSDIQELKEKLKSGEETWNKEKAKLEQDLKSSKGSRNSDDSKEKTKLTEEVTKLKKEKEEFEKALKEKSKSLDDNKANYDELQKEIERLRTQVGSLGSKTVSGSSKVVTIPVQQDKSVKAIPIQKVLSRSSSVSVDDQDGILQKAELIALEEAYRHRTKNLEEEVSSLREQLSSLQKESEEQSHTSRKSVTDLKTNFEKELNSWNKERELFKKSGKLADEHAAKISKLDKTVEELNGKLKAEEGRRRELEVKLVARDNAAKDSKVTTEDAKVPDDKTAASQKSAEFRNRFEKFGGTPRPVRKLSLPSSSSSSLTSPSDSTEKGDWVGEIQKQMTEAEKARLKDREELLEKMERQKKDFELKLEAFKETTKLLDTKSQELSNMEKKMADVHCQMEEERANWVKERSKLQTKLTDSQKSNKDDKAKVAELMGEVKKLQVLAGVKGGTTAISETSTPTTPLGTEKPSFRGKTQGQESVQNSTSSPVTSIVIPIRKADEEKNAVAEDGASTSTSNGVGKLAKKLFPPFGTDSLQSNSPSTKPYTPGPRTPIPINRIGRSNQTKP